MNEWISRHAVSSRRRIALGRGSDHLWLLGLLLAALAVVTALNGAWLATVVLSVFALVCTWLVGGWVNPFGADAYVRKLDAHWFQWVHDCRASSAMYESWMTEFLQRMIAVPVPAAFTADHESLIELVRTRVEAPASSGSRIERARVVTDARAEELRVMARLAERAATAEQHAYVAALGDLSAARDARYARAAREVEAAVRHLSAMLARGGVPGPAATPHAELLSACQAWTEAVRALHRTSLAGASETVALTEAVATASTRMCKAHDAIVAAVGYRERWEPSDTPAVTAGTSERASHWW